MVAAFAQGQIYRQMKVLITGSGGMLGTDLALKLASKYEVAGVGRRPVSHLRIPYHTVNLSNSKTTLEFILDLKPEAILHAAAMTEVDLCETERRAALEENLETTRHVTDAANRLKALVIYFSTDFVFDGQKSGPYTEEDVPHPLSVYGQTKLLAEKYLRLRGRRYFILRTSWLFGAYGNNFPKKILTIS